MDFDEYEYLEKTVENPEAGKEKEQSGRNGTRSEEKHRSRSTKHRPDEDGRESNHRSKRARSEDEGSRDRDRRGSSRHRPSPDQRSRDGERDRNRSGRDHREERNGKDRERDKEKERERTSERERESERERSRRSRSRSERHRDEERDRHRERSRETTELKERDRDARRYKEKKEEVAEPEADPERDQRTVFAYQICLKADERDVYEFFSRAGKVRDVRLIMDRNSRRSKGVGYIEFYDALSVPMAIALSGQLLLGQQVMVKPSEAEKNLVQSNSTVAGPGGLIGPYSGGARRLYVGNLHFNITEDQLRKVFEPFGPVELVQLPRDQDTLLCKGFGFVQFARLEDARAALSLNGQLEIAGKLIKVNAVTDPGMQDIGANTGDFDDDEGGGLSLNAQSRAALMQKLDRSGTAPSVGGALPPVVNGPVLPLPTASVLGVPPGAAPLLQNSLPALLGMPASGLPVIPVITPPVETAGVPTECLLLKNMFDPNVETEPDFDLDIKEDVQDECSKFGAVKHIFVEKNSAGYVYLRFDSATSAANAQRALHGRWFAGKMITATFMLPQQYDVKFPGNG